MTEASELFERHIELLREVARRRRTTVPQLLYYLVHGKRPPSMKLLAFAAGADARWIETYRPLFYERLASSAVQKLSFARDQRRRGGLTAATKAKERGTATDVCVLEYEARLIAQRVPRHHINGRIAKALNLSVDHVRKARKRLEQAARTVDSSSREKADVR